MSIISNFLVILCFRNEIRGSGGDFLVLWCSFESCAAGTPAIVQMRCVCSARDPKLNEPSHPEPRCQRGELKEAII